MTNEPENIDLKASIRDIIAKLTDVAEALDNEMATASPEDLDGEMVVSGVPAIEQAAERLGRFAEKLKAARIKRRRK